MFDRSVRRVTEVLEDVPYSYVTLHRKHLLQFSLTGYSFVAVFFFSHFSCTSISHIL